MANENHTHDPSPVDLAALERAVREDLDAERGVLASLRAQPRPVRWLLMVGAAALLAAVTFALAPRADFAIYPRERMLVTLAWFAIAAGVAAWLALRPVYLARPERSWVLAAAAFALLGPLLTAIVPLGITTPVAHGAPQKLWPWAYGCFAGGVTAGLVALVIGRLLDRGAPLASGQVVLAGAAAGLVGAIALQLHCPIHQPLHLLLGHASVPVGLIAGLWLTRRAAS